MNANGVHFIVILIIMLTVCTCHFTSYTYVSIATYIAKNISSGMHMHLHIAL